MAASNILQEAQRESLQKSKKATCLDPLQLMVMDVEGKPEILSKTVDRVAASSVAPSVLVMLNAAEMMKTKEDRHWPNYKMFRTEDILAQVQFSLQWQEFQGKIATNCKFLPNYPILFHYFKPLNMLSAA